MGWRREFNKEENSNEEEAVNLVGCKRGSGRKKKGKKIALV